MAHWLIGAGLLGLFAHWLIGSLAQASFLAFLELFCSGLRLLGSLALIAPFAHLLIGSFRPLWLLCSMAHWLIGSFVPFLAFIELIWLRPHFWHFSSFFAQPQDLSVSGLFNLKLLTLALRFLVKRSFFNRTFQLFNTSFL